MRLLPEMQDSDLEGVFQVVLATTERIFVIQVKILLHHYLYVVHRIATLLARVAQLYGPVGGYLTKAHAHRIGRKPEW